MKKQIIKFHEDELVCVNGRVVIYTIAKSIGLNTDSVGRGIKNHPILGPRHTLEYVQIDENQSRNYLTLPIEYVQGWLFSIDISRVKQDVRPKLEQYQLECFRVLHDYFNGNQNQIIANQYRWYELEKERREIDHGIHTKLLRRKEVITEMKAINLQNCQQLNLPFSLLDDIALPERLGLALK